ncbi:hypothetical protein JD844_006764, partial [Phrynosoma platyrhinos]
IEQSNSQRYSMACLLKNIKLVYHNEKSTDPGQCHLSKSRSRRLTARRRSNSFSMCVLPSIPEYPGFQDIKVRILDVSAIICKIQMEILGNCVLQDLRRTRLENSPGTNRNLGYPADHFTKGHCKTKSNFSAETLQDYYNDKLMELRNYGTKKSNGKAKGYPDENQKPSFTSQGLRWRNSCGAMIQANLMKLTEDPYVSADQITKSMTSGTKDQGTNQEGCKRNYLESLTMSINGPLEMLVRRK